VDEDGETTSFAGLHDTFLNVIGPDAVAQAVRRCLASARSARARYYRQAHGLTGSAPVAVLVQQLIRADVSAVVFSADPRTGRRGIVLINATWGLGESLVSGRVVPDLVTVRTPDMTILEHRAGNKATMTVMRLDDRTAPTYGSTTTGTHEVPVPRSMRRELCLTDRQVRQLARLAHRLEAEYGWPVDLECAYQGGELYLLQCRPITTMVKAQQPLSGDQVSAR
jgi:pyruvate,water dikinase